MKTMYCNSVDLFYKIARKWSLLRFSHLQQNKTKNNNIEKEKRKKKKTRCDGKSFPPETENTVVDGHKCKIESHKFIAQSGVHIFKKEKKERKVCSRIARSFRSSSSSRILRESWGIRTKSKLYTQFNEFITAVNKQKCKRVTWNA